jgi:hypothetical protein
LHGASYASVVTVADIDISVVIYFKKMQTPSGNICYFRFLNNFTPSISVTCSNPASTNFLAFSILTNKKEGKEVRLKIKIKGARDAPTLQEERVPTKEELRRTFLSGDKKTRTASVLVAQSGVRIQSLGDYQGKDGLTVADLPEMKIENDTVTFSRKPTMIIVRKEISKARHQYFTFLGEEGCDYIKDYLEERMREGEKLTPKSPIITPKLRMKPFMRAINVGDNMRAALRAAGLKWRPYVLRCYFDTQLMMAESKGLVLRDYRQFWMGHKGDIENRYTTNKQKLPESVIEDMREAYRRSQEFLQTTESRVTSEERLKEALQKQLLLVAGFKEDEVEKMDLANIGGEEFQKMVKQRLLGAMKNNGNKQKVIDLNEVDQFISEGWEYVASLPNDRAIIKMPF